MVTFTHYYNVHNEGFKQKLGMLGMLASMAFTTPLISKSADTLFNQLSRHEGYSKKMYLDSKGIPTIGIGFNLNDANNRRILSKLGITDKQIKTGLSDQQVKTLFDYSMKQAKSDALKFLPDLYSHPVNVQNAIIDMSFNLGLNRLNKFVQFKKSLQNKDYKKASADMLDSLWAKQVGKRATYLANLVRSS